MKRLYLTASACLLMACLIPVSPSLAVVPAASTAGSHFLYMFAHVSFLHWLINAWSLLVIHNLLRWHRLLTAYTLAVLLSYVPAAVPADSPAGVLGLSVITTFFFGFLTPYYWRRNRSIPLMMIALILIGCFIPGVAAAFHVIPFTVGMAYWHIEGRVRSFLHFIR